MKTPRDVAHEATRGIESYRGGCIERDLLGKPPIHGSRCDRTTAAIEALLTSPPPVAEPGAGLTPEEIAVGLRNIGVNSTCGACMEVFYTGATTALHQCRVPQPAPPPTVPPGSEGRSPISPDLSANFAFVSQSGVCQPAPTPGVPAVCPDCKGSGERSWIVGGFNPHPERISTGPRRARCRTCGGTGRPTGEGR